MFPIMRNYMTATELIKSRPLVTITFSSIDGYREICGGFKKVCLMSGHMEVMNKGAICLSNRICMHDHPKTSLTYLQSTTF